MRVVRAADRPRRRASRQRRAGRKKLGGDDNVAPTELDVYKPERWVNDSLFRVEVREARRPGVDGWVSNPPRLDPGQMR